MAKVTLTFPNGRPFTVDPANVRQVLGGSHAQVYFHKGMDITVRETREQALEKITAPKEKRRK